MTSSPKTPRVRALRRASTEAERKLWSLLRNRQLAGFKFRRQVAIDRYIADFARLEARLVVELDGGQHADDAARDEKRTEVLETYRWRVIRFWNYQVLRETDGVLETILAALRP